ncbi:MAG: GNAT family N-acetyltransferase [Caldilineaceae bacterium]
MADATQIIQIYATAGEFLAQMQGRLEAQEALYGLMLGLALRLHHYSERIELPPYLATVTDRDGAMTAALMTPPHGPILYSESTAYASALARLAQHMQSVHPTLPLVNGPTHLSATFAQCWAELTGVTAEMIRQERVFELRQVNSLAYCAGHMRLATMDDVRLAAAWITDFGREALGEEGTDPAAAIPGVQQRIHDQSLYLWENGVGEVVALAGSTRPTPHGISIGPVYTPPAWRGRGYATALVASLSQHLLDRGYDFCALFTDLANPTSNSIYQKIGYRPVGDYTVYRFSDLSRSTHSVQVAS